MSKLTESDKGPENGFPDYWAIQAVIVMKPDDIRISETEARLMAVRRALRHWDPIGVIPDLEETGLPPNEYDSYALRTLRFIESGADARDIALHLVSIRVDFMSLGERRPTEREQEIGDKLSRWRNAGFHGEPDFRFNRYAF